MIKKIKNHVAYSESSDVGLREKLIRRTMIITACLVILGFFEIFSATSTYLTAVPIAILLITVLISLVLIYKYRKVEISVVIVGFIAIVFVFPSIFFLSGGVEGGASIWFVLGIFYSIGMFDGKKMRFFLALAISVDILVYAFAYNNPEYIILLSSDKEVYVDSLFGIIIVGTMMGWVTKYQLVSYYKEKEIALQQKRELEVLTKSKNIFFANMSHEIRTPISTIMGLNEMILRDESIDDDIYEKAIGIQNSGRVLISLVNDILDMSLIDSNQMYLANTKYNLIESIKELIELISPKAKEKNLEFVIKIDSNIPEELIGDERRIKQVVLNLLMNAVKYTREGAVIFSVTLENIQDGQCKLLITVEDTGVGIKSEQLSDIFEGFSNDTKSSGLGLAVSKKIIELMNGEISVESIYTKGSVFKIMIEQGIANALPIGDIDFNKMKIGVSNKYNQSFEAPEAKILIVDDNEENRDVICELLKPTKIKIDVAKSGEECLEKTTKSYYNLILMDRIMSNMDGVDTMRNVRRQEYGFCRNTPIIVITADSTSTTSRRYKELGFDAFLEKPFKSSDLESMILDFLPAELIEYRAYAETEEDNISDNVISSLYRRKKIYITADCVCDIPDDLLKKYDIRLMYLYINTGNTRFCDAKEVNSDNLGKMFGNTEYAIFAEAASVEDYENFFAECLLEAEEVVHLTLGKNMGVSYHNAHIAAKGFSHVKVLDSGFTSGGMALVVLNAARMAMRGGTVAEIGAEVERIKKNIVSNFMMPSVNVFYNNGYTDRITAKICNIFRCHPILFTKQSGLKISRVMSGNIDIAQKRFIRHSINLRRKKIYDIVLITHAGLSVEQQEILYEEVYRTGKFKKIIIQNCSVTNACFSGVGTVGIAYAIER